MPEVEPPAQVPPDPTTAPLWRWLVAALLFWGVAWYLVEGDFTVLWRGAATPNQALSRELDDPWLLDSARARGELAGIETWTLEQWQARLHDWERRQAAMRALAQNSASATETAVNPDWDALFPGKLEFQDELMKSGLRDEPQLRQHFTDFTRALDEMELRASNGDALPTAESDLRAIYEAHRALFVRPERFTVRHVFLAAHTGKPEDFRAQQKELAQELSALLKTADAPKFEDLAKEYSEDESNKANGGLLPEFTASDVPPELLEKLRSAPLGKVLPEPVQTRWGYHLFRVEHREPSREMTFEESAPLIKQALQEIQARRKRQVILEEARP